MSICEKDLDIDDRAKDNFVLENVDFSDKNVQIVLEEMTGLLHEISVGYEQAIENLLRENAQLKEQCAKYGKKSVILDSLKHKVKGIIMGVARRVFRISKRMLFTSGLTGRVKKLGIYKKMYRKGIIDKFR